MSFHRPTRLELAMHEAGHAYAYAALIQHGEPRQLGVDVDRAGNVRGWCCRNTILYREVRLATVQADALPAIRWQADAEVVIAIAGPLAEFRHRHRSSDAAALVIHMNAERFLEPGTFDVDGDFQKIRDVFDYIGPADRLASFKHLIGIGADIVGANWPAVKRLGRKLFDQDVIEENELYDWFQANPAKRHHMPQAA